MSYRCGGCQAVRLTESRWEKEEDKDGREKLVQIHLPAKPVRQVTAYRQVTYRLPGRVTRGTEIVREIDLCPSCAVQPSKAA